MRSPWAHVDGHPSTVADVKTSVADVKTSWMDERWSMARSVPMTQRIELRAKARHTSRDIWCVLRVADFCPKIQRRDQVATQMIMAMGAER